MNTTQLECFMAVANFLNFSRAAELLRITQPAVSHQINTLEDELGVTLFHRSNKSVRLTQEGFVFLQYAGQILRLTGLSKDHMRRAHLSSGTRLAIGCRNSSELALLVPPLADLRKECPQVQPVLRLLPFDSLQNLLTDGEIHMMFTFQGSLAKKTRYRELCRCLAVCVCCQSHPLAGRLTVTLEELSQAGPIATCRPPICPSPLFTIQTQVVGDRAVNQVLFCDNHEAMITLVQAGYAFCVMVDLPHSRVPGLCYIPMPEFEPLSFGALYREGPRSPELERMLTLLAESMAPPGASTPALPQAETDASTTLS